MSMDNFLEMIAKHNTVHKIRLSCFVDPLVNEQVNQLAQKLHLSKSSAINYLLMFGLQNLASNDDQSKVEKN